MTGGAGSWRLADPVPPRLWSEPGGERKLSGALSARWATALEDWGAPAAARKSLEAIHDPSTVVVVTGQQPGVWGGPLYCGYKAATAVALARRITRQTGRAAVAVFWMGSDDADWDEVAWGTLPRPGLDLYRHRWSASPLGPRRWVGGASLDTPEEAMAVVAEWRGTGSAALTELPASGELAAEFARFLHDRHGEDGLLVLDARWPELRASGRDLWTRYLERHAKLAAAVEARGEEMRAAGVVPPLGPGETDHGLFIIEGDRRQEVDPDRWETTVAERLAAGGAADLAPSVILRALLQDHLLCPAAQIVGRGEAAYLQQLEPMYEGLEVAPPARIPRLHATIIPRGLLALEGVEEAIRDPEGRVAMLAASRVPGNLEQRLTRTREESRERLREILEEASGFARDLQDLGDSAARKIDQQYGRIADVLGRRGKQSLYAEDPRYRTLAEFLRPRRAEQDRGLSGLSAELMLGSRTSRHVVRMAEAHLDRLAEAQMHHFVLEAHHG